MRKATRVVKGIQRRKKREGKKTTTRSPFPIVYIEALKRKKNPKNPIPTLIKLISDDNDDAVKDQSI